jgi:hypothetical protein
MSFAVLVAAGVLVIREALLNIQCSQYMLSSASVASSTAIVLSAATGMNCTIAYDKHHLHLVHAQGKAAAFSAVLKQA